MSKRQAGIQISKDDYDPDAQGEAEPTGTWQKADESVLAARKIRAKLAEAMGCDALLAGHVLKSDTIPISRYEMPIKALFSIERPRSFLEL